MFTLAVLVACSRADAPPAEKRLPNADRFRHITYPPARLAMSRLAYHLNGCAHDLHSPALTVHISLDENRVDYSLADNQGRPLPVPLAECMRRGIGKEATSIAYTADITVPYDDPLLGP